ncbi:MAG TPA: NAD-binding protein [Symbiobacteriaceae bacterium]|nr:NAD-binding protein [Symbiobacteriaceae bacterium]
MLDPHGKSTLGAGGGLRSGQMRMLGVVPVQGRDRPLRRWSIWLFASLLLFLLLTSLNSFIFARAEGVPLSLIESALFVLESLTTTGFGSQTLEAPVTQLWAILLMVLGVLLIAGLLTSLVHHLSRPMVERLPAVKAPGGMRAHLIIVGSGPMGRYIAQACQQAKLPHLLLDQDHQRLQMAVQEGFKAVDGDPGSHTTLQHARVAQARALILTERDGTNLTVLLQALALAPKLPVYATQAELPPALFKRAGAAGIVSAKRTIGRRLGALATAPHLGALEALERLIAGVQCASVPVLPGTPLISKPVALAGGSGLVVLGVLTRGVLLPASQATQPLLPGDLVLVVGRREAIESLRQRYGVRLLRPNQQQGPVLILGAGATGRAAAAYLKAQGVPVWMLDRRPLPSGWQVERFTLGDATVAADLRKAGAASAGGIVIALPDDEAVIIATMMLSGLQASTRLVCRANKAESVAPLYVAGAEAVVTLPLVGGAALARLAIPSGVALPTLGELVLREVPVPGAWVGRPLRELALGGLVGVAVRRLDGTVALACEVGAPLAAGESLVLFGPRRGFDRPLG